MSGLIVEHFVIVASALVDTFQVAKIHIVKCQIY